MFVITPMLGNIFLVRRSISPFLFIPTSKIPILSPSFILNKEIGGPDASFSLDETEFTQMVNAVRAAEKATGKISYQLTDKMKSGREFSRSLYITTDVKKGDFLTEQNVRSVRPGFGMHPKYYNEVLGKKFNNDFDKGTALNKDCFE